MENREGLIIRGSMALPYHNGIIWCMELDGLGAHTDVVSAKLAADFAYAARPSTTGQVALHLKDTLVTEALAAQVATLLAGASMAVRRVAFVGLDRQARRRMEAALQRAGAAQTVAFYEDYEMAKAWLIPG